MLPIRINKYIAQATGCSRRAADALLLEDKVRVNGQPAVTGQTVSDGDIVTLNGSVLGRLEHFTTIMLNKPKGCVVSRDGQGSRTIYDILPLNLQRLKAVGRLDKYSSGLLILTDDGHKANELTHPSRQKVKQYEVSVSTSLQPLHRQMIQDIGITLDDGVSKFQMQRLHDDDDKQWIVTMREGRNRQIRRTFSALGYSITRLHRTHFGSYSLGDLHSGSYRTVDD